MYYKLIIVLDYFYFTSFYEMFCEIKQKVIVLYLKLPIIRFIRLFYDIFDIICIYIFYCLSILRHRLERVD